MNYRDLAANIEAYIIEQRRWFHQHPELSWEEVETTKEIVRQLEAMGYDVHTYPDRPGCWALLKGGKATEQSKTVILRADIDALPVLEKTGLPFASVNPGVMHACGHDCHIAMQLGAAKLLMETRDQLEGNVKIFFQAAEETCSGAKYYIDNGILDGADAIFGMHIWNDLESGMLNAQPGPRMASCGNFKITIEGISCHGSNPSGGIDAMVVAAAIIMNLQTIVSRTNDPRNALALTVGTIQGGQRFNILANQVVMEGTTRTYSKEMYEATEPLMRRIVENTAATFGAKATLEFDAVLSAVINRDDLLNTVGAEAALKLYGEEGVKEMRSQMGSEDFAMFTEHVPGIYCYVGSNCPEHNVGNHNDAYDVDEAVLKRGAAMAAQFAFDYLAKTNG